MERMLGHKINCKTFSKFDFYRTFGAGPRHGLDFVSAAPTLGSGLGLASLAAWRSAQLALHVDRTRRAAQLRSRPLGPLWRGVQQVPTALSVTADRHVTALITAGQFGPKSTQFTTTTTTTFKSAFQTHSVSRT